MTRPAAIGRGEKVSLIALPDGRVRPEVLADPYPLYAALRAEAPAVFDRGVDGWLVSRYGDVRALALDERLHARRSSSFFCALAPRERTRSELFSRTRDAMVFYLDGEPHTRVRRAVAGALHDTVAALGPALIARHAETLVAQIAAAPAEVDLVRDLAVALPRLVLADLLGLPQEAAPAFYEQSVAIGTAMGGVIRAGHVERAEHALGELRPHLLALAADATPGSILARLRGAVDAGDLHEDELLASAVALSVAGHETTTSLLGNAVIALARHPSTRAPAASSAAGTRRFVDEVLRYDPPTQLTAREAGQDLQVAGRTIPRGDRVILLWASANRDPERFERADAFEPGRSDHLSSLSFGVGPHHCPGSSLARTEAEIALRVLLNGVGSITLTREPTRRQSFTFRGPATLPAIVGRR